MRGAMSIAAVLACAGAAWAETVDVRFVVTVPDGTPADATVYLAGSVGALGGWRADGLALERQQDGTYAATVALEAGRPVEYKVTLGAWAMVEKDASGGEVANRELTPSEGGTVNVKVAAWASTDPDAPQPKRESTVTGNVKVHEAFASAHLPRKRALRVYLPPGYEENADKRYAVFYMHDGKNLFDAATASFGVEWRADETADRLISAGRIEPIIIVGIDNTDARLEEYGLGETGDAYAKFVAEEVKPFIDKTYRTKPGAAHTALGGSSMGGLTSLHIARRYPDAFSKLAVVSPALVRHNGKIFGVIETDGSWLKGKRVWFDMGTNEGAVFDKAIDSTRRLEKQFKSLGLLPGKDYYYLEVHNAKHNEAAWAARFDTILLYLFGRSGR